MDQLCAYLGDKGSESARDIAGLCLKSALSASAVNGTTNSEQQSTQQQQAMLAQLFVQRALPRLLKLCGDAVRRFMFNISISQNAHARFHKNRICPRIC